MFFPVSLSFFFSRFLVTFLVKINFVSRPGSGGKGRVPSHSLSRTNNAKKGCLMQNSIPKCKQHLSDAVFFLHGSNSVTVFQVYLFAHIFQHMFQGLLIVRYQLQTWISRSHHCEKMFQLLQTLTFAWNNSTEAFATESSASQHSDVFVRLFESDTRVIKRARLGVHSTWVSGNFTRLHADFTTVVILSVTVDLVSMFLLRCPGKC